MKGWTLLLTVLMSLSLSLGCISVVGRDGGGADWLKARGAGGWTLAYAHDKNGNRTAGSLAGLMDAVRNGREVRIVSEEYNGVEFIAAVDKVWIRGNHVFAQVPSVVSSAIYEDEMPFIQDSFEWMYNYCTSGKRDIVKWMVNEHKPGPYGVHASDRMGVKWFVR